MADRVIPTVYADITAALVAAASADRIIINSGNSYLNQTMHGYSALNNIEIRNQTGAAVTVTLAAGSYVNLGTGWSMSSATSHKMNFSGGGLGAPLLRTFDKVSGNIADATFSRPAGGIAIQVSAASTTTGMTLTRVEAYGQAGSIALAVPVVDVVGSLNIATLEADNCWFEHGSAGVKLSGSRSGTVRIRRSFFKDLNRGIYYYGNQTGGLDARFNVIYTTGALGKYGIYYDPDIGFTPSILLYRNTMDVTTKALLDNTAHANANVAVRGNWGLFIDAIAGATYSNNSTAGAPGFTDQGANDYTLTPGSVLVDAGWDTGDATDIAGNATPTGLAADIGAYEYIPTNGGLDSLTVEDAETILATFINNGANTEPLEASAIVAVNWSITGDYAIAVSTAVKIGVWQYRVTLSRPTVLAEALTVDVTAVDTVGGGVCTDPASLGAVGVQYPDGAPWYVETLSSMILRAYFLGDAWYSYPSAGALDPSVWQVLRDSDSARIDVLDVSKIDDRTYLLTLADDMEETKYRLTTTLVPTEHGGVC